MASLEKCAACQKGELEANLKLCTGCRGVWYCGAACQKSHWKEHREHCKARAVEHKSAAELAKWRDFHPPSPPVACPVCDLPMPLIPKKSIYMPCCGETICHGCSRHANQRENHVNGVAHCPVCDTMPPCMRYHVVLRKNIAENDDADAMYHMGEEYLTGGCGDWRTGVPDPEDIKEGIDLLRKAADHGSIKACCRLAMYHKRGHYNCKVSEEKEVEYMKKAAEAGCLSIHGQLAAKTLTAVKPYLNFKNDAELNAGSTLAELAFHHARIGTEAGDDDAMHVLKTMGKSLFRNLVTEDELNELVRIGEAAKAAMDSESRARADRADVEKAELLAELRAM